MAHKKEEIVRSIPPAPRIAVDSCGKAMWLNSPALLAWLREYAPKMTNSELMATLAETSGRPIALNQVAHVRRIAGIRMDHDTSKRAYDKRVHCQPEIQKLTLLGPADKERFVSVQGDTIVTSDWHVPHHHEELVARMLQVAKALNIKQLVINGDFLNEDAFSRWPSHPFNVGWQTEKHMARSLLQDLVKTFDRIYYILDNHDRRIIARHERPTDFTEDDLMDILLDATTRGVVRASTFYRYVTINDVWRVTSPKDYRRAKLSLPGRLAQLHHTNIISGGDHLFGLGVDDSARYVIANNCCVVNPAEVPYINVQDTSFPQWSPGFYAIIDNVLHPFVLHENLWPTWWQWIDPKRRQGVRNTLTSTPRSERRRRRRGKRS